MSLRKSSYKNLKLYYATKRAQQARWRQRAGAGTFSRQVWSEAEDEAVLAHSKPDRELAKELGRSIQSIYARRTRLKKQGENYEK